MFRNMASKPSSTRDVKSPESMSTKTQYLVLYNLLSMVLWLGILLRLAISLLLTQSTSRSAVQAKYPFLEVVFPATWDVLRWTQSLALLEIAHAAVGLVRTSIFTTAMQVASRLLLVWGILHFFAEGLLEQGSSGLLQTSQSYGLGGIPGIEKVAGYASQVSNSMGNMVGSFGYGKELNEPQQNQAAYAGMLLAWSATEVIRYLYFIFYAGTESGKPPALLTFLRYNTFFVLYPLGISCECWLIYKSIPFAAQLDERYALLLKAILAIYVPGSYILYTHMMAQRRKVMKGKGKAAKR